MPETDTHANDLALMLEASRKAADIAMSFFRKDPDVWFKNEGRSPVSEADVAIDRALRDMLVGARPGYGWLSEEAEDSEHRLSHSSVFVVDPIDGTRAYVAGRPDWCVSIGLVEDGVAVAGVLAAPAREEIWLGVRGGGASLNGQRLASSSANEDEARLRVVLPDAVVRAMHGGADAGLEAVPGGPSLALRLAGLARGEVDGVYVRPQSNEWDLAAADVLLSETGNALVDRGGARLKYNSRDPSRALLLAASERHLNRLLAPLQPARGH